MTHLPASVVAYLANAGINLACLTWLASIFPTSSHPITLHLYPTTQSIVRRFPAIRLHLLVHASHALTQFAPLKSCPPNGTNLAGIPRSSTEVIPVQTLCNYRTPLSDYISLCHRNEQRPAASRAVNDASNAMKLSQNANDASRPTSTAKATPPKKC